MSATVRIRDDIRARLMSTGAFTDVYTHLPEQWGRAASDANAAAVEIPSGRSVPRWDGGARLGLTKSQRFTVTLMARNQDPTLRDEAALDLLRRLESAINGQSLASITVPDHTYVESWTPLPERTPERRYRCIVTTEYIADNWDRTDPPA